MPPDKVVRDGMVAVLVSPDYGAGWYSWEKKRELLFDPELVTAVERDDTPDVVRRAREISPEGYFDGAHTLEIRWVPQGTRFRIDEYDGFEEIVTEDQDDWIVA